MRLAAIVVSLGLLAAALWTVAHAPPPCSAWRSRSISAVVALEPMLDGQTFEKPIAVAPYPSRAGEWLVATHRGVVLHVANAGATTFLDIRDRVELGKDWGLQDIALAPGFPSDPRVFVVYVTAGKVSRLSRFHSTDGGRTVDRESEAVLLAEAQPIEDHTIASLRFGPDGYLYVGWGEGGIRDDESHSALRGKLLRIDVGRAGDEKPYTIPNDNPFVGTDVPAEAYAIGLRMPWRFSFDRDTGALWLADVGSHHFEEVDRIAKGGDYGWPRWEGTLCLRPGECPRAGTELPMFQQTHSELCAIVGGYVYRGQAIDALRGKYVYADACTGTIWALDVAAVPATSQVIGRASPGVASFAEDSDGELYVVELRRKVGGELEPAEGLGLRKIIPSSLGGHAPHAETQPISASLAEIGCVARGGPRTAPPNMIRYEINQPQWEDGAETIRFTTLAAMEPIYGVDVEALAPATGSVLLKTILVAGRPIETQLLSRRDDGTWDAFDYMWNEEGTDAMVVTRATQRPITPEMEWHFPGPQGCERCHNLDVGIVRAFTVSQLHRDVERRNQFARLEAFGTLVWPWKGGEIPKLPALDDARISIEDRARAYLHVNCAHCHQPGGRAGAATMDLRRETPLALAVTCGASPHVVLPGYDGAMLIAPGDPRRSLLSVRLRMEGSEAMPPERRRIDEVGVDLVDAWIRSIASCP